jgi:cation transport ATPase
MFDPPRGDTAATIREAGNLGIKVKMLTGDAVAIAIETCKQLGVGTKVYDSQKLISGGGLSGSTIHDFVEAADGFGEVFPEHKYQVVELLQDRHHLVAMTGDGTNECVWLTSRKGAKLIAFTALLRSSALIAVLLSKAPLTLPALLPTSSSSTKVSLLSSLLSRFLVKFSTA